MENQRLRNELESYKKEKLKTTRARSIHTEESAQTEMSEKDGSEEFSPYRLKNEKSCRLNLDSNASSLADSLKGDLDPTTMERLVLTESVSVAFLQQV